MPHRDLLPRGRQRRSQPGDTSTVQQARAHLMQLSVMPRAAHGPAPGWEVALAGLKSQLGESASAGRRGEGCRTSWQSLLLRRALHALGEQGDLEEKGDSMAASCSACDGSQAVCHPGCPQELQSGEGKKNLNLRPEIFGDVLAELSLHNKRFWGQTVPARAKPKRTPWQRRAEMEEESSACAGGGCERAKRGAGGSAEALPEEQCLPGHGQQCSRSGPDLTCWSCRPEWSHPEEPRQTCWCGGARQRPGWCSRPWREERSRVRHASCHTSVPGSRQW